MYRNQQEQLSLTAKRNFLFIFFLSWKTFPCSSAYGFLFSLTRGTLFFRGKVSSHEETGSALCIVHEGAEKF
jgi:hypothetical protein